MPACRLLRAGDTKVLEFTRKTPQALHEGPSGIPQGTPRADLPAEIPGDPLKDVQEDPMADPGGSPS